MPPIESLPIGLENALSEIKENEEEAPLVAEAAKLANAPALPDLVGAWLLPSQYRTQFEQHNHPVLYGPLTFGCGSCVATWYEGIRFPVLHVRTNNPPAPISDDDVLDLTAFLTNAMQTNGHGDRVDFVFLHDLRHLWPRPSRVQLNALIKFVGTNKKTMDAQLKCIAIIVSSPVVRKLLNFFMWLFKPIQPVKMMATPEEGLAFLREHCGTAIAEEKMAAESSSSAPAAEEPL